MPYSRGGPGTWQIAKIAGIAETAEIKSKGNSDQRLSRFAGSAAKLFNCSKWVK
jgi:hypothetical protein